MPAFNAGLIDEGGGRADAGIRSRQKRRKGGISDPPCMADAKAEMPNGNNPHTMRDNRQNTRH